MRININIPDDVRFIIEKLENNGYKAYAVGGCVRDTVMKKVPNDWDICTNALPDSVIETFNDFKLIKSGLKHGTVGVIVNHIPYEVTTFRIDGEYHDNRRPDNVIFVSDLERDLQRRDFTINAMAYNESENLVDPYGGCADIENKTIRCVGNPDLRFNEDALRIMRALRFTAVLGFGISEETSKSILKNKDLLKNIAIERIRVEFEKILLSSDYDIYFKYKEVFAVFIPEALHISKSFGQLLKRANNDISQRLSLYIFSIHPDNDELSEYSRNILNKLKYDKKTTKRVYDILTNRDIEFLSDEKIIRKQISLLGYDLFRDILTFNISLLGNNDDDRKKLLDSVSEIFIKIKTNELCCHICDLAINGNDLINAGICNGIKIKKTLELLLDMVINDEINNNKNSLLTKAHEINSDSEE